jgi:transcriptional regulator with XRE-family HTH domain
MGYITEEIGRTLRSARAAKGLSQRALSRKAGVPQGHISKIENGAVDLRVSSLIALARFVDLELTLVPRKTVPAVRSILRSSESAQERRDETREARKEFQRLRKAASDLPTLDFLSDDIAQIQRQVRALERFKLSQADLASIRASHDAIEAFLKESGNRETLRRAVALLRQWRNARARGAALALPDPARPAHSLDDDDHA